MIPNSRSFTKLDQNQRRIRRTMIVLRHSLHAPSYSINFKNTSHVRYIYDSVGLSMGDYLVLTAKNAAEFVFKVRIDLTAGAGLHTKLSSTVMK